MSKRVLSTLAVIAAVGFMATAAQAGGPSVVSAGAAPSPSTVNQSVTLTATLNTAGTCPVDFIDQTNGNTVLCSANSAGTTTASCPHTFTTAGARTIQAFQVVGPCSGGGGPTFSHTVNPLVVTVPTMGEWALLGFGGALLLGGAAMLARRTRNRAAI